MTLVRSKCYPGRIAFSNIYYFEPIQINVVQSGNYTLSSVDNHLDGIRSYLYKEHFNEFFPYERLIAHNSDGCPNDEFKIITELQSSVTYILIMMPRYSHLVKKISIVVFGPNNITFNPISKSNIELIFSSFD